MQYRIGGSEVIDADLWLGKAAALDPEALATYVESYDLIVPDDECWYLLSAWNAQINGLSNRLFQRMMGHTDAPIALPAGSRIKDDGAGGSSVLLVKPSLVAGNPDYDKPKRLFERRMGLLTKLPVQVVEFVSNSGINPDVTQSYFFPTHFSGGIIKQVSVQDLAWLGLFGPAGLGLPLTFEISDFHEVRIGEQMHLPFKPSLTDHLKIASANIDGSSTAGSAVEGRGVCLYSELPEGW